MYHFSKKSPKNFKKKSGKNYDSVTVLMEKIIFSFEIDRARYHGGALEGNSVEKIFQNANEILK